VDALPPGSYLAVSHATADGVPPLPALASAPGPLEGFHVRTRSEFARFFAGHELVPPGVVPVTQWRAEDEPQPRPTQAEVPLYGAVARRS
jgi:hypothetical protein